MQDFYHLKRENNPLREDAFTLSCLGKLFPASSSELIRCRHWLSRLLDDIPLMPLSCQSSYPENGYAGKMKRSEADGILIIGLTESGIIPAFLMHLEASKRNLYTCLIYSSRRRSVAGIGFNETHSHGPNHMLALTEYRFKEIWIVEDEITSGNTVINLMGLLKTHMPIERVRIFAFADFRTKDQKAKLISNTAKRQILCSVHIPDFFHPRHHGQNDKEILTSSPSPHLFQKNFGLDHQLLQPLWPDSIPAPAHHGQSNYQGQDNLQNGCPLSSEGNTGWHLPPKRPALGVKSSHFFDSAFWVLSPDFAGGTLLAVGEAVDLAACLAWVNRKIAFQQISLSPWQVDHQVVFSRMRFADRYYLYNYDRLDGPVFIISDPVDRHIELEVIEKLKEDGIHVKPLAFATKK